MELGCGVKARESEASRFDPSILAFLLHIHLFQIFSEVAALREEKVDAEKRVEAGLKNLHQKEEKITLLQVKLTCEVEIILFQNCPFRFSWRLRLKECLLWSWKHSR